MLDKANLVFEMQNPNGRKKLDSSNHFGKITKDS
jgi:hypothetical protein